LLYASVCTRYGLHTHAVYYVFIHARLPHAHWFTLLVTPPQRFFCYTVVAALSGYADFIFCHGLRLSSRVLHVCVAFSRAHTVHRSRTTTLHAPRTHFTFGSFTYRCLHVHVSRGYRLVLVYTPGLRLLHTARSPVPRSPYVWSGFLRVLLLAGSYAVRFSFLDTRFHGYASSHLVFGFSRFFFLRMVRSFIFCVRLAHAHCTFRCLPHTVTHAALTLLRLPLRTLPAALRLVLPFALDAVPLSHTLVVYAHLHVLHTGWLPRLVTLAYASGFGSLHGSRLRSQFCLTFWLGCRSVRSCFSSAFMICACTHGFVFASFTFRIFVYTFHVAVRFAFPLYTRVCLFVCIFVSRTSCLVYGSHVPRSTLYLLHVHCPRFYLIQFLAHRARSGSRYTTLRTFTHLCTRFSHTRLPRTHHRLFCTPRYTPAFVARSHYTVLCVQFALHFHAPWTTFSFARFALFCALSFLRFSLYFRGSGLRTLVRSWLQRFLFTFHSRSRSHYVAFGYATAHHRTHRLPPHAFHRTGRSRTHCLVTLRFVPRLTLRLWFAPRGLRTPRMRFPARFTRMHAAPPARYARFSHHFVYVHVYVSRCSTYTVVRLYTFTFVVAISHTSRLRSLLHFTHFYTLALPLRCVPTFFTFTFTTYRFACILCVRYAVSRAHAVVYCLPRGFSTRGSLLALSHAALWFTHGCARRILQYLFVATVTHCRSRTRCGSPLSCAFAVVYYASCGLRFAWTHGSLHTRTSRLPASRTGSRNCTPRIHFYPHATCTRFVPLRLHTTRGLYTRILPHFLWFATSPWFAFLHLLTRVYVRGLVDCAFYRFA